MSSYSFTAGLKDRISLYEVTRATSYTGSETETVTLLASGLKARLTKVRVKLDDVEKFGEIRQLYRNVIIEDTAVLNDEEAEYRLVHGSNTYEIEDFLRQRDDTGRYHHVSVRCRLLKFE